MLTGIGLARLQAALYCGCLFLCSLAQEGKCEFELERKHLALISFLTNRPTIVEAKILQTPILDNEKAKLFGKQDSSKPPPGLLGIRKDSRSALVTVNDSKTTNFASYGFFRGQWWQLNRPFIHTLATSSDAQPIISTLSANEDSLNFGIVELANVSLEFDGALFTGLTKGGSKISGKISGSTTENESKITYSIAGKPWTFEIRLIYNEVLTVGREAVLPKRFISSVVTKVAGTFPVLETEFISLTTTNGNLPDESLDPKVVFANLGPFSDSMRSNGTLYFRPTVTSPWQVSAGKDGSPTQPMSKAVLSLSFLVVSGGTLFWLVKQYKTQKKYEK